MKLDILEYTGSVNRAPKEKVRGIGAWMNVLSFLSIFSAILNCFTIVAVSTNVHEFAFNIGTEYSEYSVCLGALSDESTALNYSARNFDLQSRLSTTMEPSTNQT